MTEMLSEDVDRHDHLLVTTVTALYCGFNAFNDGF